MRALEGAQMLNKKLRAALPPPIKPLANKAPKHHKFDTAVKGPVDWKYWRHIETVELWQALLLSLNITPPGNGWLLDNASGQTGDIPYAYLDAHGLTDKFTSRCRLLRNRLETLHAGRGAARNVELTEFIGLPLFAAWATEFEWDLLPQELLILANQWNTKRINLQSASDNQGTRTEVPTDPKADAVSTLDVPIELIVNASAQTMTHKIRNRNQPLDAEIASAKEKVKDATSATSVWDELTKLAESKHGPMIGFSSDGIQYRGKKYQATGVPDIFTSKNLRDRMARAGRAKTR
jgi:hypothetical protein